LTAEPSLSRHASELERVLAHPGDDLEAGAELPCSRTLGRTLREADYQEHRVVVTTC